ncbi:MAG: hypothetical protein ABS939_02670 [Psychrobacillus sp.]
MTTYQIFSKHAQKLQKKGKRISRPTLQGIYHTDSHVVMTDSHRLYQANITFPSYMNKIVDPKTGQEIDGNYPDTTRLVPEKYDAMASFSLDIKEVIAFLKAVKALKIAQVSFTVKDDGLILVAHETTNTNEGSNKYYLTYKDSIKAPTDFKTTTLNTVYLLDAFEWLKEYSNDLDVYWYGNMRPVLFTPKNFTGGVDAIILPIRVY